MEELNLQERIDAGTIGYLRLAVDNCIRGRNPRVLRENGISQLMERIVSGYSQVNKFRSWNTLIAVARGSMHTHTTYCMLVSVLCSPYTCNINTISTHIMEE